MRGERLALALDSGAIDLPESGRILVMRPRAGDDLSAFDRARLHIVTGFRPDFEAFTAMGYTVSAKPEGDYAAAVVCVPRARELTRAMFAEASRLVAKGGPILVDGQKTDGIESALKELKSVGAEPTAALSKAHGKIFAFNAGVDLSAWEAKTQEVDGFKTRPGVFSADGIDRGSALLAAALPDRLPYRVADLGAGWGYLTTEILKRNHVTEVHLVEAEADALEMARLNVQDPRAVFHWADATKFKPVETFGAVICNPPFHSDRNAEPGLGIAFLRTAARILSSSGTLWLVANRQLPYQPVLETLFKEIEEIGRDSTYRLIRASRPIQVRK